MAPLLTVSLSVTAGAYHTCALLDTHQVKCWGGDTFIESDPVVGSLGVGDIAFRGVNPGEMGDALPEVDLGTGRSAKQVSAGISHTCVVLDTNQIKCWGGNSYGQLGYGDVQNRGGRPSSMGDDLPTVDLGTGRTALSVQAAPQHTCALLDNNAVKCWGSSERSGMGDQLTNPGSDPNQMGDNLAPIRWW